MARSNKKAGTNPDTGKRTYFSDREGPPVFDNPPQTASRSKQQKEKPWYLKVFEEKGRRLPENVDYFASKRDALEEAGQELTDGGERKG